MGTKKFDSIVRKKLEGVEAPTGSGNWEAFRKKLEEAPAVSFDPDSPYPSDQIIAQKLGQVPVPGSPESTWPLLEKKLRDNAVLRDRIFFYKSLELCLVLFFTALAWEWTVQSIPNEPSWKTSAYSGAPVAAEEVHDYPHNASSARNLPDGKPGAEPSKLPERPSSIIPPQFTEYAAPSAALAEKPSLASVETNPGKNEIASGILQMLPTGHMLPHLISVGYELPVVSSPKPVVNWQIPAIAVTQLKPLPLSDEDREEGIFTLKSAPKRALLNIGMLGSSDFNRVMTPPNYRYRINAFDQYSMGYGGGFLFGLEYGRMEIGSGLVYSAKQYRPLPVIFIKGNFKDGYVGESLKTVQLNMINLPVYLRYDALRKDKWRAYVSAGASLQVAFEANYFFAPPTSFPDLAQTPAGQSTLRNRTEGWFEGGAFKENSYVTANLAIGAERFVSERWGIFVQPTYHRSIGYFSNGLGPNLDRIHTFSIWTGIRVRIQD